MKNKPYIFDKLLHWSVVLMLLFMLNLSTELHYTNWEIKGPILHRQDAVQFHASIGLLILLTIVIRAIFSKLMKDRIPRLQAKSNKHKIFIKLVHTSMYLCLFLLVITGLGLVYNYEIPLTIYGIELVPIRENFLAVFPTLHEFHLLVQTLFWWSVAVHLAGFIYAKR